MAGTGPAMTRESSLAQRTGNEVHVSLARPYWVRTMRYRAPTATIFGALAAGDLE